MALFGKHSSSDTLEPPRPGEGLEVPIQREELVMALDPYSQVAEQFRHLCNSVQALNPDGASRSILMTSATEGEGKSVASLNLAIALAELPGQRVLVLDSDIYNPSIEHYLGLPRRQGFTEVLRSLLPLDQAIRTTAIDRLDIIGAGSPPPNPAEILNTDRLRAVFDAIKRRYDYVLLDAPPALGVVNPSVMGSLADGIILVVRMGVTPKLQVEEAYRLLENLGGNVLGTCLTGTHVPNKNLSSYGKR